MKYLNKLGGAIKATLAIIIFSLCVGFTHISAKEASNNYTKQLGLNTLVKIALVGNSITFGYQLPAADSYPSQLQVLLDETYGPGAIDVRNFGHSSKTMVKKSSFTYWTSSRFTAAKTFQADITIILLGTNDARGFIWDEYAVDYPSNYIDMINEFKIVNPNMKFLLGYPPPIFNSTTWNDNITTGVIPGVDSALGEVNTQLIDFNTPMQSLSDLFPDNVHPTPDGYAVMATIAYDRLIETNLLQHVADLIFADGLE